MEDHKFLTFCIHLPNSCSISIQNIIGLFGDLKRTNGYWQSTSNIENFIDRLPTQLVSNKWMNGTK